MQANYGITANMFLSSTVVSYYSRHSEGFLQVVCQLAAVRRVYM